MSIGLYDADQSAYGAVTFNLELMKIASYYKKRKEIVILSPFITPERHQKFYIRKDYDDGEFSNIVNRRENVEYGGRAFDGGHYTQLPLEIEQCVPDTSIYGKVEKDYLSSGLATRDKIFKNLITAEHCRISLDGKTVWDKYPTQFKQLPSQRNIIFHDYDLGAIDGQFETVQEILKNARNDGWATRVGMKFPVQISNGAELLKWSSLRPNSDFFWVQYNGVMDDDTFFKFIQERREKSIYGNLDYYVTAGSSDENDFNINCLQRIFRQVIIQRSYSVFFSLKYEDGFFKNKLWEKVIDFINFYHNSLRNKDFGQYLTLLPTDTAFDFAKALYRVPANYYRGNVMNQQEARQVFNFVREQNYPVFKDFYECTLQSLEEL